ncbi:hypothetical protein AAKU61_001382 [Undibacterium sp. GrIS 1.2]|uniref:hypothetical protein n=1 Tax=Undibacterium sp. GrIS 1.2 TaxID=3143933 RepID=UPI0033963DAA
MKRSNTASQGTSTNNVTSGGFLNTPMDRPQVNPLDSEIEAWTNRMQQGVKEMATTEEVRKAIAERLF